MKRLVGLKQIEDRFDTYLIDLWGVVYDGNAAFPNAVRCLEALLRLSKRLVFVSNSSESTEELALRLEKAGISTDSIELVTSGELTGDFVIRTFPTEEAKIYFIPEGMRAPAWLNNFDWKQGDLESAHYIIAGGPLPSVSWINKMQPLLSSAARRGAILVCLNPDKFVVKSGGLSEMSGVLATCFETLGGQVLSLGKPNKAIFDAALSKVGSRDKHRAVMIGDSVECDIVGARRAGIQSVFVRCTGISRFQPSAIRCRADFCIDSLTW